jgi:hypothetical protein
LTKSLCFDILFVQQSLRATTAFNVEEKWKRVQFKAY